MVHQSLKSLTEAKEILIQSRGKLRDQSDRIEKAIELAALIQTAANAMQGKPTADEMIAQKDKVKHPFQGF